MWEFVYEMLIIYLRLANSIIYMREQALLLYNIFNLYAIKMVIIEGINLRIESTL